MQVDSELTVNGETLDSPAIESKNFDPNRQSDYFVDNIALPDLEQKLAAQAASGQDEIVIVTTREFRDAYGSRLNEVPDNVRTRLESNGISSDVTIEITTYEDLAT